MAAAIPTENPIILDITTSFGASIAGSWLLSVMWGISSLQVFIYFMQSGETDPTPLRLMACISALWLLDTVNAILIFKGNWRVLIHQYGRIAGLSEIQPEILIHTWFEVVVIFVVQIYFIRRIYLFAKKAIIRTHTAKLLGYAFLVVMVILAAWQFIGLVGKLTITSIFLLPYSNEITVYQIYGYGTSVAVLSTPLLLGLNISLRAAAVAVDGTVAVCMVYLLTRGGGGHLRQTKRMVHRLLLVSMTSGTVTAVAVSVVLILLSVYPDTLFYCIIEYSLCSLYFSTLLANLNSREYVQGRNGGIITSFSTGRELPASRRNTHVLAPMYSENGTSGVRVERDVQIKVDKPDAYSA
ncbi:hypothetical protein C8R44DRAFT_980860 [Mycena epipterygia]|nr:hypothetical protein C8R44DRAFT_980860 [Mycena epipterygia]